MENKVAQIVVDGLGGIVVLDATPELKEAIKIDSACDFFEGAEKLEEGLYFVELTQYYEPADVHGDEYLCCDIKSYKKEEKTIHF